MALASLPTRDLVWASLLDPRSDEQRSADAQIDRECRDEPDPIERLRQDALALCAEYFDRIAQRQNQPHPPCPGCEARRFAGVDLVAQAHVTIVHEQLIHVRKQRRAHLRVLAGQLQAALPLEMAS